MVAQSVTLIVHATVCPLLSIQGGRSFGESTELYSLNECADCLVKFVKKSGEIQYNLPATLKSDGKTRPWCSLISKFSSILTSFDALRPLLRDRKRDDLLVNIDVVLLEEVLKILQKAEAMFDILLHCHSTICFASILFALQLLVRSVNQ